jgi:hypothetical protein
LARWGEGELWRAKVSTEDGEGLLAVDYLSRDGHFGVMLGTFLDAGIKVRGFMWLVGKKEMSVN